MQRDSSIWLTNESNRKLDRVSMAYSIEARSPFQDERVIRSAKKARESMQFKMGNKDFLRKTFPELSGVGVRSDKAGFISPVGNWLRTNPGVVTKGLEAIADSDMFNKDQLMMRKGDQFSGDYRRIMQLWALVVFGYWYKNSWKK
jgi:asparagine synthase (glutamine-hydrolysing)